MTRNSKRKIIGITGIRSEYDIMSSVYRAIVKSPAFDLELFVTGAHLSEMYGSTVKEIEKDGFPIADRVVSLLDSDTPAARVKGLGIQLQGMIQTLERTRPDFILVLGDREEAIASALAGAYMNIAVAHIGGGDRVVGNVDDQVRHAVSKLAHLHFATNKESCDRLLKLGEQPFRVFNSGNPGLDRLVALPPLSSTELSKRLGFEIKEKEPFILLIQHPLSSSIAEAPAQMKETLTAVKSLGIKTVLSYPNSDAGSHAMIRVIEEQSSLPHLHVCKNIPRPEFVNLMRRASCLLGNSSAGILEAPLLKLPVVNVGKRQEGRLHAENVQFVPHDSKAIMEAVKRALFDENYRREVARCSSPYGDGQASDKIVEILASIPIDNKLLVKDITY